MSLPDTPNMPSPGTACRPCRQQAATGHFCPAKDYLGDEPVCLSCLDGVDCPTIQARKRLHDPILDLGHPAPATLPSAVVPKVAEVTFQSKSASPHVPAKEKTMPKLKRTDYPICRYPHCDMHTRSAIGVCVAHWYWGKKNPRSSDPAPQSAAPKAKSPKSAVEADPQDLPNVKLRLGTPPPEKPVEADGEHELVLRLTESQCDALYRRCSPGQKSAAIAAALQEMFAQEI